MTCYWYWMALLCGFGMLAGAASVFDAWPAIAAAAALGALITGRAATASIRDDDEEEQ